MFLSRISSGAREAAGSHRIPRFCGELVSGSRAPQTGRTPHRADHRTKLLPRRGCGACADPPHPPADGSFAQRPPPAAFPRLGPGAFLRCDTAKGRGRSVRRGTACLRPAGTRSPTSPLLPGARRRHLLSPRPAAIFSAHPRRHLFPSSPGRTDAAGGAGRRCRLCGGALGACLCGTVGGGGSCFRFRCPCCRREVRGPRAEMWRNLLVRPPGRGREGKGGEKRRGARYRCVSPPRGCRAGRGSLRGCRCPAGLQDSAAW